MKKLYYYKTYDFVTLCFDSNLKKKLQFNCTPFKYKFCTSSDFSNR